MGLGAMILVFLMLSFKLAFAFSRKNIYFCFIDYAKVFDCVDHNKLENS